MNYWVIIPAAGNSSRMQSTIPKQYLNINDKAMLSHVLDCFLSFNLIKKIIVVLRKDDSRWESLGYQNNPKIQTIVGAEHRCKSVLNGLQVLANLAKPEDWVLVHDAARPYLKVDDLNKLISEVKDHPVGGILGIPMRDTVKKVLNGEIVETLDRTELWRAATPQMFRFGILKGALETAIANNDLVTDEAAAIELMNLHPRMIECSSENIKITTQEDYHPDTVAQ